jgi:hypothetical protein
VKDFNMYEFKKAEACQEFKLIPASVADKMQYALQIAKRDMRNHLNWGDDHVGTALIREALTEYAAARQETK